MSTTQDNGIVTPINSDAYNLTPDLATMANTTNAVTPVANQGARDALTKFVGRAVTRNDVPGQPIEIWSGSTWQRQGPLVNAGTQITGSGMAANAFITGSLRPYFQAGTFVGATDAAGNLAISYPVPFPTGVVMAIATSGDSNIGNLVMVPSGSFSQTVSTFYVNVKTGHTGAILASSTVRCNWIAMGW